MSRDSVTTALLAMDYNVTAIAALNSLRLHCSGDTAAVTYSNRRWMKHQMRQPLMHNQPLQLAHKRSTARLSLREYDGSRMTAINQ